MAAVAAVLLLTRPDAARALAQATAEGLPAGTPGVLLIASMEESRVDVVDETTLQTLARLDTGKGPHEVRVAPDGQRAFVVAGATVTVVDLRDRTVARTIDLGESAHDVRVSRDGRRLWAACARVAKAVLEVDLETGQVVKRYPTTRDGSWFVEINRDENKLYTPNLEGRSVSVITRATGEVKVLPLEFQAYGIDITPDGRHILVSGRAITIVDTQTDAVVRTIAAALGDTGRLRIMPDGERVVVAQPKALVVFDIRSGDLVKEIPLPATPKVLALSGDGRRAYVTNPEAHSATIVDLGAGRVLATFETGRRPDGIAWAPGAARRAR
jgi:DNA-binding beta-propeller fold protein YncE